MAQASSIVSAPGKPFLKWAGGKTQILAQLAEYYPPALSSAGILRYVEPFLGGGAVFLDVIQRFSVQEAVLFDVNEELVLVYKVVQQAPDCLIELLKEHRAAFLGRNEREQRDYFYEIRAGYNEQRRRIDYARFSEDWVRCAASMIFLNKTCFNGLYRKNSNGAFNVPFGRYKHPSILDEQNIQAVSQLLQKAELYVGSFEACEAYVDERTFVYFDPPYRPISPTSSFTSYSQNKFSDNDQVRLAGFFGHLSRTSHAKLMLSNSDPADRFFDDLYAGHCIHRVYASRMINSNAGKRGRISELVITNY